VSAVTVLLPAYNAMPYLTEAVRSILEQTLQDFLLLIIDDGSTDGTGDYLAKLRDPRITAISRAHCGLGATLNEGLALCETEFLARMDADDVSLPHRLEAQVAFLRRHPAVGMVGTQFSYIGANGTRVPSPRVPCEHAAITADLLEKHLSLVHGTLVFRTSLVRSIGGYRIAGIGEDWDLFLRMVEVATVANLSEVHYLWRLHCGNSNPADLVRQQMGIEYACLCAVARANGKPEAPFVDFCRTQAAQGRLADIRRFVDAYALAQYRIALGEIATDRQLAGSARLLWAALCPPPRTWARVRRVVRKRDDVPLSS
jgi:glycosyltransferase involved in cell wall biosynthesis